MIGPLALVALLFAYMAALFGVGLWAEKRAALGLRTGPPMLVYALAQGVYCTSWTYYGNVGSATSNAAGFLAVYLGPTLVMLLAPSLLRRMVELKERFRITSVADFVSTRYDRSVGVGALVTALLMLGVIPYIGLQIRALTTSFSIVTSGAGGGEALSGLLVYPVIALAIAFGVRRLDASARHPGFMTMLAVESIVKLVALSAVGLFAAVVLFDGPADVLAALTSHRAADVGRIDASFHADWLATLVSSMAAVLFLPRMFHVTIVENTDVRHLYGSMWLFPLYLLLFTLFVLPIAAAGLAAGLPAAQADSFVLQLPLVAGAPALAALTFLGGYSAATAMVMVSSAVIAIMATNHLLLPLIEAVPWLTPLRAQVVRLRWVAVAAVIVLADLFQRLMAGRELLVNMGIVSFAAVLQVAPAAIGGLLWRRANRAGALLGMGLGFTVWAFTLALPKLASSGWAPLSLIEEGPFGIALLRPVALFGLTGLPVLAHAVFWSLLANLGGLVFGSLLVGQSEEEAEIAAIFAGRAAVGRARRPPSTSPQVELEGRLAPLVALLASYLGAEAAAKIVEEARAEAGLSGRTHGTVLELMQLCEGSERALAGVVGSAMARRAVLQAALFAEDELTALGESYARLLAELRVGPEELSRRVDHFRERNEVSERHARELDRKVLELQAEVAARAAAEAELQRAQQELEARVVERTAALRCANEQLVAEQQELRSVNEELADAHTHLLQSEKLASLGLLAAGVAHEINNPLAYVSSNVGSLARTLDAFAAMLDAHGLALEALPAELRERLQERARGLDLPYLREDLPALLTETREGLERVQRIVRDLREFAHVSDSEWKRVDLHDGLESTLKVVMHELRHRVEIRREYGELPLVDCIPGQLNQLFLNLIVNAAQAIEGPGTVTLRTAVVGASARIEVSDTGCGIPREHRSRIFEPFFSTKPVGKGTGLGLALSFRIVEKHGGRIELESEVGRGTTFRVLIPLERGAQAQA